jgi:hypothetical protein
LLRLAYVRASVVARAQSVPSRLVCQEAASRRYPHPARSRCWPVAAFGAMKVLDFSNARSCVSPVKAVLGQESSRDLLRNYCLFNARGAAEIERLPQVMMASSAGASWGRRLRGKPRMVLLLSATALTLDGPWSEARPPCASVMRRHQTLAPQNDSALCPARCPRSWHWACPFRCACSVRRFHCDLPKTTSRQGPAMSPHA